MRPNRPRRDRDGMVTTILTAIGAAVLILNSATRLPAALAELLHSCQLIRDAISDLCSPQASRGKIGTWRHAARHHSPTISSDSADGG
jgi:hypothetical protein